MLVDDKLAKEKIAKAVEGFSIIVVGYLDDTASDIVRQTDLSDCKVEVDFLEAAHDWQLRAESLSAQVAELKKDAERYLFIKDDRRGSLVESLSFMDAENWNAVIDAAKESGVSP